MKIAGREIGSHQPPYIISEISANHNGSVVRALELLDAAKEAGADAAKIQTYTPGDLCKPGSPLWSLYEKAQTPRSWHEGLFRHARNIGLHLFSSPFSVDAVKFLERFDPPAYKIASMEVHQWDMVNAILNTCKPVIVSTGMMNEEDLHYWYARPDTVLLHCIAQYPARIEDANLSAITTMQNECGMPIGLSDHTSGIETAIAATALGAVMIEKHLKLSDDCIDAAWSLDPAQFKAMAQAVRSVWQGMGDGEIRPSCKPRDRDIAA